MKRFSLVLGLIVLIGCGDANDSEAVDCWIVSPLSSAIVGGSSDVQVGFSGAVTTIELLAGSVVVAQAATADAVDDTVTISWDTTGTADGSVALTVRAEGSDSASDPISVTVDNTLPVASIGLNRLDILEGQATVPLNIIETNLSTIRLLNQDGELVSVSGTTAELTWDTTAVSDQVHAIYLEITDQANNTSSTTEIPVIVMNNGEEVTFEYIPAAAVEIPDPFNPYAEFHTRTMAYMDDQSVTRVIVWLTWDASNEWPLELAVGQGFCPHRGIEYYAEESSEGEIYIDLARTDLTSASVTSIQGQMPSHPTDSTVFPYNGDPATLGAFFGHIAPLEPEEHEGQTMAIEVGFVFIYDATE